MADFRIRFLPDGCTTTVAEGQTLLEAARGANLYVGAICGGEGTCGKCRLIVREGEVEGNAIEFFTRDEIRHGYVLACQAQPLSDLVVEIPPESQLPGYIGIVKDSERFRDFVRRAPDRAPVELDPLVKKFFLILPEPSVDDPTADQERLLEAVAKLWPGPLQVGLRVTRELPRTLRYCCARGASWSWKWHGRVTATVGCRGDVNEVLCVERGDTSGRNFGLALDVGTTTVVGHLVDVDTGVTCEAAAKYNSQIEYGADIISRINYARQPGGGEALQRAIVRDIDTVVNDLVQRAQVGQGDIHCVVAAGNTAMMHFLLGVEADLIRVAPFVPAITNPPPLRAAELGIRIHPRGTFYTMPAVGSYVGGDVTAGILASGMHRNEELSLLLDIGTNGEVVVGNRDFMVACSASAGPAFEGGSVTCGMRATFGAIDSLRILPGALAVSATTIDDGPPLGLCGTGLIDALAQMFLVGLVDRSGRFQPERAPGRFRICEEDGKPEFVLVSAKESGNLRDVVMRQTDVENLIRTKGAIYAAADSLVRSVGLSFADIRKLYIAGAFGNKLDISSCITIGLLPDVPMDQIHFIGNSSAAGAKLAMLSRGMFDEVQRIRSRVTYQELMVDPGYMDNFLSACFLPHTDLSRFPSVAKRCERRAGASQQPIASKTT
ncbi:MAG: ASKHA domain-containing protein [Pirellulales bacterium]